MLALPEKSFPRRPFPLWSVADKAKPRERNREEARRGKETSCEESACAYKYERESKKKIENDAEKSDELISRSSPKRKDNGLNSRVAFLFRSGNSERERERN